jgi:hypothetical protein
VMMILMKIAWITLSDLGNLALKKSTTKRYALKIIRAKPLDGPGVLLRQHLGDEAAQHAVRADT